MVCLSLVVADKESCGLFDRYEETKDELVGRLVRHCVASNAQC